MTISETTFGPRQYLTLRKQISISQVSDHEMYAAAGNKLGAYMRANGIRPSGPWTVLYFKWDMVNMQADLGISFPVEGVALVEYPELSLVQIPAVKACTDTLRGPYEGLGLIHRGLMQYAREHGYSRGDLEVMAVEEYVIGGMTEQVSAKWKTDIYYLHK